MDERVKKVNKQLSKIQKGNLAALDELHNEVSGLLLAMAKKYLADKSYAEDIVSEVFLKVAKGAETFNGKKNGLNWLCKTTKNTALDFNKKEGRCISLDENEVEDILDYINSDDSVDIKSAIEKLDKTERLILYKKHVDGYTVREIAEEMNMTKSKIQRLLNEINEKIKKLL